MEFIKKKKKKPHGPSLKAKQYSIISKDLPRQRFAAIFGYKLITHDKVVT